MTPELAETYPRPLSEREMSILRFMLSSDDRRLDPLRDQADSAQVVGKCTCGCATIDLAVDREGSRQAGLCSPAVEARTPEKGDGRPPHELLLFLDEGWLASVEIVYFDGDPPRDFPPPDALEAPQLRC